MSSPKIKFKQSKSIEELKELYNVHPELSNFHLGYSYDPRLKLWEFTGYRCVKCEKTFKKPETLPNHNENCPQNKERKKYGTNEIDPTALVLTHNRKNWKPYDSNHKNSL